MPPSPPADELLDAELLRRWALPDDHRDDKVARGTVLVIGGSRSTPGAVVLAGVAALRVGAGRLQLATAPEVAVAVAVAVPEARVIDATDDAQVTDAVSTADAIVVGPGHDELSDASRLLELTLASVSDTAIVVIDAFGLAALAERSGPLGETGVRVVATPNREELAMLHGDETAEASARSVAAAYGMTVTSYGRVVDHRGRSWVDHVGVTGLGTSGSGDVLAGAIGGFAARSGDAAQAACWGTLMHRAAASRLASEVGPVGYLARELTTELPRTMAALTA